jgi:hypothetical protein
MRNNWVLVQSLEQEDITNNPEKDGQEFPMKV